VQRRALRAVVGEDLSLPVLVAKMAGSEEVWRAVVTFCEEVVLQKETAERIRRQEIAAPPAPAEVAAAAAEDNEEEGEPEDDGGCINTPSIPPPAPTIRRSRRFALVGGATPAPTIRRSRRLALTGGHPPPDTGELRRRGGDVTPPP